MDASRELLIGEMLRRNARAVPRAVAASLDGALLRYGELDAASDRIAHALAERGVGRGERVVCWADTSLDVVRVFAGCARAGAVFAPLNARTGPDEAVHPFRLVRPKLLVADAERAGAAKALAEREGVAFLPIDALDSSREEPFHCEGLSERDPQVVFFTSGSTGAPKGVVVSHRANHLRSTHGVFRDAPERSVCMFPLFHMGGFTLALSAWQTRGEIVLVPRPTAEALLDAVQSRRASRLYCIPAVWTRVLAADLSRWDLSTLREVDTGTSATPLALLRALREAFPQATVRVYYGSTEVGAGTVLGDADVLERPGSVGLPAPGVELRLADDGEILIRSPYLFDGYWDDPEATAAALRGGWFHTADRGALDADGYLQVVGRVKELIRTGGESVAPTEVEAVLGEHERVREVAVVGIPDDEWGEVVCAVVVADGEPPTLDALRAHCEGRLARFKHPRRISVVESLPRTAATGQVQRALIVQQIVSGA